MIRPSYPIQMQFLGQAFGYRLVPSRFFLVAFKLLANLIAYPIQILLILLLVNKLQLGYYNKVCCHVAKISGVWIGCAKGYLRWPRVMWQVAASELEPCSLWMIWEKRGVFVPIFPWFRGA